MNDYNDIFSIKNEDDFLNICFETFFHQVKNCEPYSKWINLLNINIKNIKKIEEIPFLPVELFKSKRVYCSDKKEEIIFSSSSTTGIGQSFHYVEDVDLYEKSFTRAFSSFYGKPSNYAILGLLPSYLERTGSSLIYMVDSLIKQSANMRSGFFLHNFDELYESLCSLRNENTPTILIGVTYALLDFVEKYSIDFPDLIVMETGGMKGRREEVSRARLHEKFCLNFGVQHIHSEYGMTETLSQAYSKGGGKFLCPSWMKILIRDIHNPFKILNKNESGGINIIDLANYNSCSFIATQDLGKTNNDNSFEILGRLTASDIRGCNLLVQ
ncbi:MAG: acyltransferase [Prevotellaceae bacterium]|jgi:phenylacetate-coenzyme A ligase PaaK-like adenylate-forming protein|nr:acyltransferase [Prevotellaceae bacterium]